MYDWSMVEDWTGEELSQDDKDQLNDVASQVESFLNDQAFATQITMGAVAGVSAFAMAQ